VKPPPFAYFAPGSLEEATSLLAEHGDDAKVIAGGQSLIPLLSLRLARPSVLVDLNGIDELTGVDTGGDATTIGAMTRHRAVERSDVVARNLPLMAAAAPFIGHAAIRSRGTVGGSLSHADPAAELPAVALALDAVFTARSATGEREIVADDFFAGYFTTTLEPDEVLSSIRFPNAPSGTGVSVQEMARRHGDFAMVAVAAAVTMAGDAIGDARLALINVADRPVRALDAEAALRGSSPTDDTIVAAADAATRDLSPVSDLHASAAYRRTVAAVLVRRALTEAVGRARSVA
jgi:aerobic carbon-monoxide dehydrogenase medium subunit